MANVPEKLAALERALAQVRKGQRIAHGASIENAAVTVNAESGQVRAILGVQGDGTVGVQAVNGPPPPQPSDPVVASVLGGVTVSWDGTFAAGAVIPMDWQRVEVHASITPVYDPVPATLVTTIETAQGATVVHSCDTPVHVRLLARNTSGAASPASGTVGPYGPTPVVADDILDGIVTTLKLADDAVTSAKVATGAIDTNALANAAVTAAIIAADAVTSAAIIAGAVGSTEISNGAITTPKLTANAVTTNELAATAVTAAKIAAGAVIAGKLDANSVTAGNIAAAAVQAGNLAANSVQAGNIAANAVQAGTVDANAITARELNALAVTAGKLAANAVTAGTVAAGAITTTSLAAGSVDATALAATAITGKTITGGTITGALIQTAATGQRITLNEAGANKILVYSSATAIGELSDQGLLVKGSNGAVLWLDPNNPFPNLRLTNASGTNSAVINVSGADAVLGMNSGQFTVGSYTDMKWRSLFGSSTGTDFWAAERVRDSNPTTVIGGRAFLGATSGSIGYRNSDNPTQDNVLIMLNTGVSQLLKSKLEIYVPASTGSALYVKTDSGHTGNMLRLDNNGTDAFRVDASGNATVPGVLNAASMITGSVNITPSAANTPTSALVTYSTVPGTTFRGFATANTTVPGVRAPTGNAGVTGVGVSSVTSTSMLVWVNRENTTPTTVNWQVIGS